MKRFGLRVLVGLMAFGIGVSAVILNSPQIEACLVFLERNEQTETLTSSFPINSKGNIELHFIGYGRFGNRPTLKFKVMNYSAIPIKYRSSEAEKPEIYVKFNGVKVDRMAGSVCALRMEEEFILHPKTSFQTEFVADLLTFNHINKNGKFQFGFSYFTVENYSWKTWTQSISISEKMKKDIIKGFNKLMTKQGLLKS